MNNNELNLLLSETEMEILKLLAYGKRNIEIATRLNLSTEIINTHINSILEKMRSSKRVESAIKQMEDELSQ